MNAGIGHSVRRKEDARLLTGLGRYSDDVNLPGQAYSTVVRSPHAHARIRAIDTKAGSRLVKEGRRSFQERWEFQL